MPIFEHAIASFDPSATSVLLWTRLSGSTSAGWVLAADPGIREVVASGSAETGAERDFTVTVAVDGLQPATSYWYRFEAAGELSQVGRTRTLPAGPVSEFHLATVSCARYSVAPLTVYRALAQAEVDLVLHLGDYIYEDEGDKGPRVHDPHRTALNLDDYRRRIAQIRRDPDAQALHLRHPMMTIWDDHDFADNAWLEGAKAHGPELGPWTPRRDAAARAHREWLPSRTADPDPLITYRSVAIGDLAELILLDTRIAGRDCQASVEGAKDIADPGRSLLGEVQREWLGKRLADTSRPWALVASSVVVNPIPLQLPLGRVTRPLLPEGYVPVGERVLRDDQWDGYPAERERLMESIGARSQQGARTVLLSGDVHSSWAFEGPDGPDGAPATVEVTTPSVSSAPLGRTRLPGLWRLLDSSARQMDHVRWAEITLRGFTVIRIRPDEITAAWWFVDPYDTREEPAADCGAAFSTAGDGWPPEWVETPVPVFPAGRLGLPDSPAGRPSDVRYIRRWHLRRRYGVLGLVGLGVIVPTGAAGWLARRAVNRLR